MTEQTLYRFFDDDDNLLYVGISVNAYNRAKQHSKDKHWWPEVKSITLNVYPDRESVELAEINAIKTEKPIYNTQHNVDKPSAATELLKTMDELTGDEIKEVLTKFAKAVEEMSND